MDEKMFSLMEKMYGEMQEMKSKIGKTVINRENDHGKKLQALFDV